MHRRFVSVLALLVALILGCGSGSPTGQPTSAKPSEPDTRPAPEAETKAAAEAKWAKEVAQHFLDAFAEEKAEAMRAVSTKAFAKQITRPEVTGSPVVFTITSQEFSLNLEQASFRGIMESKSLRQKRSFSLLMEKEEQHRIQLE